MKARIADIGWIFRHGQPNGISNGLGFGVWGRGGMPNGIRPLIVQRRKGAQRDPLLIPWDL